MKDKLTVTEACKLLPHSEQAVRRLINLERINATKLGRDWYIDIDEIKRLKKDPKQGYKKAPWRILKDDDHV